MPVYIAPPPQHYEVSDGYAAAQGCRAVLDPLDFTQCENQLSMRYKTASDKSPDFLLGFTIAILARADQMERQLKAMPPSPAAQQNIVVASSVAMAGLVAVETAAKKDGVAEADLPALIFRISGMAQDRWTYWRAKPVPDWLAKQAAPAKTPLSP